eukprot:SAG22_NODE_1070_length_5723_cov_2.407539_2_plen_88_part_00
MSIAVRAARALRVRLHWQRSAWPWGSKNLQAPGPGLPGQLQLYSCTGTAVQLPVYGSCTKFTTPGNSKSSRDSDAFSVSPPYLSTGG